MKKTAKVVVTWELEIPVDTEDKTYKFDARGMLIQEVFDGLVNYSICKHLDDATNCLAFSKGDKKSTVYTSYRHHQYWAELLRKAEQRMRVNYDVQLPNGKLKRTQRKSTRG